ncbi:bifunctional methylenetetrahydrofolate dehydrogenase/methenyltetrahydrofolate cyclohydrolase FolD [Priestia flexa]|jgi:methylenetetrahydrofolate dehydrogenase (NADP+) / methenyltetrahydrofolate cyclohydrolase|uniref:Bifunctional protein FolD n=3 Tax=Priestia TaxID=2800373 RepID=A0A0V8JKC6_9BACI|nr:MULTISPECIES: bifunctional methylenetetrahydrofolate dehydrogenase/methenyltetrahydrofolate cyclohydrolase FolD [Bacillaceae]KSU87522.1 bifunctional 5,10-methylene-tetrahydrofolate dehydrogenase/5,10-methylene-tetrahydrofolate cyclohydrolase [Priestia veravalensis]KZB92281.1 bifunctional methylenetetrahydrofolate dehydrogenase/methenyltetrahydrofolate cyclohydrolase [Bacillus sp. VT 712]MBN8251586.1 bifunctional methylenetetrahydrofolate dehydrogenase/methenyltetrahydrofolate cyclohydrolase F
MTATIIKGKEVAAELRADLKEEVAQLKEQGVVPGLTVILVGDNPASHSYVKAKAKACEEIGVASEVIKRDVNITQEELLQEIQQLNESEAVHGILVQLPLPNHIDEKAVLNAISPKKDVDGFHPVSVGNMVIGDECYLPCTPHGIIELIKRSGEEISGKHAVVIGRSNIVGKPVAMLLLQENATVTIAHSRTKDLSAMIKQADILVSAVGRPRLVKAEDLKPGAIVIDVGNTMENGKLVGDIDYEPAKEVAGYITPVPGGVGPMTITMLLKNTVDAAKTINNLK